MSDQQVFLEARELFVSFPMPPSTVLAHNTSDVGGQIKSERGKKRLVSLEDVSFRLKPGDSLGVIGHNGAGKTTLLKTLAGILQPTAGKVLHRGELGNALNTRIGFRPERSGRHNIRLKAIIAGKTSKEIPDIIEDVEAFAQLGPFLDMPMHAYSAGMRARIAFGIATAFHYDILILDEWLSAGDKRMRGKAADRMRGFVDQSAITVMASHSRRLLTEVCNRGIVLSHARVVFEGTIDDAVNYYESHQKSE